MRRIYLLSIILFISSQIFAQKKVIYRTKGDKEFNALRYRAAIQLYKLSDTTDQEVIQKIADSYRAVKDYKNAQAWYQKQAEQADQTAAFYLKYADVLAANGQYEASHKYYNQYLLKKPSDKRAKNLSDSYNKLKSFYKDSADWKIKYLAINTPKDEFSPVFFKRGLIFSSNRDRRWGVRNVFGWTETPFTDLYIVKDTAKIAKVPPANYFYNDEMRATKAHKQRLPVSVNDTRVLGDITYPRTIADVSSFKDSSVVELLRGGLNTAYHDGPASFSGGEYYMIYNRNQRDKSNAEDKKNGIYKLNMYSVNYLGGTWYNKQPFKFNNTEYSTAHPALSEDGKVLYFVSDMPGGLGGKDIYYSTRESRDAEWSEPKNLGSQVNTEGDESFPYLSKTNKLFFSSDGLSGLGGLDIFSVELKNNLPASEPHNLGYPVNSAKDDFGIILSGDEKSGYLSSNRYGSDDILSFNYDPFILKLEGTVYTDFGGYKRVVENALVKIEHDNQVDSLFTDNMGRFTTRLAPKTDYSITANKAGYSTDSKTTTTKGITKSTTLYTELLLHRPLEKVPAAEITNCQLSKLFGLNPIYYDLDKSFIRPDAVPALTRLASLLKQYPQLTVIASSHCDSRASKAYNVGLSLRRSESAKKYLVSLGINPQRIKITYHGETQLTNQCGDDVPCSEEEQQRNRRTEFMIFKNGLNLSNLKCD
ncbi:OmpA family protein [Desertivirga arenae]|uniref:OmpA family protein n=1 Tax=Desertivirga arenae TaxID=2810309 RepID=UPI001A976DCB|nr:OmpA family protein [Pedobacter sp. SYSU D00823]